MNKVVISAALTGTFGDKENTSPYMPLTAKEIAEDVVKCARAGAAICHIHVRNKDNTPTMDTGIFKEVYDEIQTAVKRENIDVIINLTTSGGGYKDDEQRMAHLKLLKPEMCSYDAGTINWYNDKIFMNSPVFLKDLGKLTMELGIKPEVEVFEPNMIKNAVRYLNEGCLQGPLHFQFVLGTYGGMAATVKNLLFLQEMLPEGSTYSVSGIGAGTVPMMMAALALGADGLRVGIEDNVYMKKGEYATNEEQVKRAVELCKLANREAATAAEARELLHLPKRD